MSDILFQRVEKICLANPWLLGWFEDKEDKKPHIAFNRDIDRSKLKDIFKTRHDIENVTPGLDMDTMADRSNRLVLQRGKDRKQPFWKIVIVVPPSNPESFLVLVSMSHVVGDGYTYYSIYNMMFGEDIRALDAKRNFDTMARQEEAFGKKNFQATVKPTGFLVSVARGFLLSNLLGPIRKDLKTVRRFAMIDTEKINSLKESASQDPSVPYVSTNDVLVSWFFNSVRCKNGTMAFNLRNKVEGHTENMAGCYGTVLIYRQPDMASPALIRKSILQKARAVTNGRDLKQREFCWQDAAMCSNWASFCSDDKPALPTGCEQLLHFPMVGTLPSTVALLLIFKARPNQYGIMMSGRPSKLDVDIPFESVEPMCKKGRSQSGSETHSSSGGSSRGVAS